ncbi:CBS and ACT domain-containing protein [Clostridium sediminicola]|uniref:CBS and ACT domain-containing protein n=1 Tax=Clostridium sediminicola TaxID=3114879 RepID=UPI0031F21A44
MYVKNEMSKNVLTVTTNTPILKTLNIFTESGYSQIPVIDENCKVVGLITERILRDVTPSKATSLSISEMNYLLQKTLSGDVMQKEVVTASQEILLEEAAKILRDNDIGSLPILDDDKKLVGMITRTDITNAFIRLMGFDKEGTRISVEADDHPGALHTITGIIKELGMDINSISTYELENNLYEVIFRIKGYEIDELVNKLNEEGYKVLSVLKH